MDELETIRQVYRDYWQGMLDGDAGALRKLMAEDYTLRHMTGVSQTREEFLRGLEDGTFRYFEADHESIDAVVRGDTAEMTGRSRVLAAVYGGGKHMWRLRGDFTLRRERGVWKLTSSRASTY